MTDSENTRTLRALPTDDPALVLCRQLDALLTQETDISRIWSAKEAALRAAEPDARAKAQQEFDDAEGVARRLDKEIARLFRAIESARGTMLAGIAAKLRVTLRYGSPGDDTDEMPWPQIRSVLLDLEQLTANDNVATV